MMASMILLHKLQPGGVYFIEDLASGRYLVDGDKQHIIQVGGGGRPERDSHSPGVFFLHCNEQQPSAS